MNFFDDFCEFVRAQKWMSEEFGNQLVRRVSVLSQDAYSRGQQQALSTHTCDIDDPLTMGQMIRPTLETLKKKHIDELKSILRGREKDKEPFPGSPYINSIKRLREITGAGLKESKYFIDALVVKMDKSKRRVPTGINTVEGKNRYGNK